MNRKYCIYLQLGRVLHAITFSKNSYLFDEKLVGVFTEKNEQRFVLGNLCFCHQQQTSYTHFLPLEFHNLCSRAYLPYTVSQRKEKAGSTSGALIKFTIQEKEGRCYWFSCKRMLCSIDGECDSNWERYESAGSCQSKRRETVSRGRAVGVEISPEW